VERPADFADILSSFDSFVENFNANFGIPNRDNVAHNKIKNLKQGRLTASTYAATFRKYAVDLDWNESTKMRFFRGGLNPEVKKLLLPMGKFDRLEKLISAAIEMDQELHNLDTESNTSVPTVRQYRPPSENIPALKAATAGNLDAMEVDAMTTRRGPLSADERERRARLGLCFYCGGTGHLRAQCPVSSRRSVGVAAISSETTEE
jgi:hypothetical protein